MSNKYEHMYRTRGYDLVWSDDDSVYDEAAGPSEPWCGFVRVERLA
jgi:hypothetical protein